MKRKSLSGGIFGGKNALGLSSFGAAEQSCQIDPAKPSELVKKIQLWLKANGAPNIHVDGYWQGCTAAAYQRVVGGLYVTCDKIAEITGIPCDSISCMFGAVPSMSFPGMMTCNDGSDGVNTQTDPNASPVQACQSGFCFAPSLKTCVLGSVGLNPLCVGSGSATVPTSTGGACPEGQISTPLLGCVPNLMDPNKPGQTTQGQPSTNNPIMDAACAAFPQAAGCPQNKPGSTQQPSIGQPCPDGQFGLQPLCYATQPSSGTPTLGGPCPNGGTGIYPACMPGTQQPSQNSNCAFPLVGALLPGCSSTQNQQGQATSPLCNLPFVGGMVPGCPANAAPSNMTCQPSEMKVGSTCYPNPLAALSSIFGGGGTTPGGGSSTGITTASFWGSYGLPIALALGLGVSAIAYFSMKKKAPLEIDEEPEMDPMAGMAEHEADMAFADFMGDLGIGGDDFSGGVMANRRHRKHRRGSRRHGRR